MDNAVTSVEALNAQYQVLSGGYVKQADSEKVLESALKLTQIARAGGQVSSAEDNAKALSKTMQAYGATADQAKQFGAVINATVENGLTTIPELAANFGAVGNSANKAGISVAQLGAATATLTSQGSNTAEALTGISRLADTILNKTPEATAEIAKLSLEGKRIRFDAAEVQAKGFTQALIDLYKAAGSSPQALAKIFPDTVSYRTAISLLSSDGARLKSTLEGVSSATAQSLDDVAKISGDNRIGRMERLANRFGELLISIAQSIAPVIEPGLAALENIASFFANLPDGVKTAIGQYIVLQIQLQSTTAAVRELVGMFANLFGTFLTLRGFTLLLNGQLGAQVSIVKQLILQKQGLGSVLMQIIGIDQRYRLGLNLGTEAMKAQGLAANVLARAQTGLGNAAATAAEKARAVVAANRASAAGITAAVAQNQAVGQVVATGSTVAQTVKTTIANVGNSQTVQAVKSELNNFLGANPSIGTNLNRAGNFLNNARLEATAAIRGGIASIPQPTNVPTAALIPVTANQLAVTALTAQNPALVTRYVQLTAAVVADEQTLATQKRVYQAKVANLERQKAAYVRRLGDLDDPWLSAKQRSSQIDKLNRDAAEIARLTASTEASAVSLKAAETAARSSAAAIQSTALTYNQAVTTAATNYAPALAVGDRAARLEQMALSARQAAIRLETVASSARLLAPDSPQTAVAAKAAEVTAARANQLETRLARVSGEYQALSRSSGLRTAQLAEQGLKETAFGGRNVVYQNAGLQGFLYQSAAAPLKLAGDAAMGTAKALAQTTIAVELFGKKLVAEGIPGAVQAAKNIGSGALKLISSGEGNLFQRGIQATSFAGEKALPFLAPALAGAVGTLAIPAAVGLFANRRAIENKFIDDKLDDRLAETYKKADGIKAKYTNRTQPFNEIRSVITGLKEGDSIAKLDPVRDKLKLLEQTGEITAAQFGKLSESIGIAGQSGKVSAKQLGELSRGVDKLRLGEKPDTRGIGDKILDAPGFALKQGVRLADYTVDSFGGLTAGIAKQFYS